MNNLEFDANQIKARKTIESIANKWILSTYDRDLKILSGRKCFDNKSIKIIACVQTDIANSFENYVSMIHLINNDNVSLDITVKIKDKKYKRCVSVATVIHNKVITNRIKNLGDAHLLIDEKKNDAIRKYNMARTLLNEVGILQSELHVETLD